MIRREGGGQNDGKSGQTYRLPAGSPGPESGIVNAIQIKTIGIATESTLFGGGFAGGSPHRLNLNPKPLIVIG